MAWRYRYRVDEVGVCGQCGEDSSRLRRPGFVGRVRHFLLYGSPAPEVWLCTSGHETDGQRSVTFVARPTTFPALRRLGHMAAAIRDARSMEPVPIVYLVAAAVGVVVGITLDLTVGWRWWLVAVVVVAGVWGFFLSSAFRGEARRSLTSNLRMIANPERAHLRELEVVAAAVADGSVEAYGIADWPGPVTIGGWGGSNSEIRSVGLDHYVGEERGAGRIIVRCEVVPRRARDFVIEQLREDFVVNSMDPPPQRTSEDLGQRMTQRRWQALQQPPPEWDELALDVDGVPTAFKVLSRPGDSVGVAEPGGGGFIVIRAERAGLEVVSLTKLAEISRYVDGSRAQIQRHRRR